MKMHACHSGINESVGQPFSSAPQTQHLTVRHLLKLRALTELRSPLKKLGLYGRER